VSGSTEKLLRVWDPRTGQKTMKLKGHTDNVKSLLVYRDGSQVLSGSSDGTIRLWSIGQQRCIISRRMPCDAVWALQANENWSRIYCGGRDGSVWVVDLRQADSIRLLCREEAAVLRLLVLPDEQRLCVATTASHVNTYSLAPRTMEDCFNDLPSETASSSRPPSPSDSGPPTPPEEAPLLSPPDWVLPGGPSIRQAFVLNDKRHVLTRDTQGNVALFDVLKAVKVEDLGVVDFEKEKEKRNKMVFIPSWFTVDLKTGLLAIHLSEKRDEVDCMSAWVSEREAGLGDQCGDGDVKVNYGELLLKALFAYWPRTYCPEDLSDPESDPGSPRHIPMGNKYFSVPPHTPLILSEVAGRTLYRLLVVDAQRDTEEMLLQDTVPPWLSDILVDKVLPRPRNKVFFFLQPHPSYGVKREKRDRLSANDFITLKKVAEHVAERVVCPDGASTSSGGEDKENLTPGKVQLLCCERVLDGNMDLRTVQHFIWNSPGQDLVLHYRPIK